MTQNIEDQELTLMNTGGVFVKMRKPNIIDVWKANIASKDGAMNFMISLLSEICLFDGEKWDFDKVLNMDVGDCAYLIREYSKRYGKKP